MMDGRMINKGKEEEGGKRCARRRSVRDLA